MQKRRSLAEFKEFVYSPGEGHFFCFCPVHINLMVRKQDVAEENQGDVPIGICAYPKCRLKATHYFFPNLYTVLRYSR